MNKIVEGLDPEDLKGRINPTVHFDEYVPKMGKEDQIIVASFRVFGKQPAYDLENFMEKGYDWIIDAETSPGELKDGDYLVFLEAERRTGFVDKFLALLDDIRNISDVKDWQMVYFSTQLDERKQKPIPLVREQLNKIPLSPRSYREMKSSSNVLESMLNIARIPRRKGDINGFTAFTRRSREG